MAAVVGGANPQVPSRNTNNGGINFAEKQF
jgi:hypothetical protein